MAKHLDVYKLAAEAMGYRTVTIPYADVYQSMQTGVCEGVKDPACLSMTTESLTREYPLYTPSLLNLVKTSETRVKGISPEQ